MAFNKLSFSKDWRRKEDFPTYEADETKVRADMQLLHEEMREAFNNLLYKLESENGGKDLCVDGYAFDAVFDENNKKISLQDALKWLKQQIVSASIGDIPSGTLGINKFENSVQSLLYKGGSPAVSMNVPTYDDKESSDNGIFPGKVWVRPEYTLKNISYYNDIPNGVSGDNYDINVDDGVFVINSITSTVFSVSIPLTESIPAESPYIVCAKISFSGDEPTGLTVNGLNITNNGEWQYFLCSEPDGTGEVTKLNFNFNYSSVNGSEVKIEKLTCINLADAYASGSAGADYNGYISESEIIQHIKDSGYFETLIVPFGAWTYERTDADNRGVWVNLLGADEKVGTIKTVAGAAPKNGVWLECTGAQVSSEEYPELYEKLTDLEIGGENLINKALEETLGVSSLHIKTSYENGIYFVVMSESDGIYEIHTDDLYGGKWSHARKILSKSNTTQYFSEISYVNGYYAACVYMNSDEFAVYYTDDLGKEWSVQAVRLDLGSNVPTKIFYWKGNYVFAAGGYLYYSENLTSWTKYITLYPSYSSYGAAIKRICIAGKTLLAVSETYNLSTKSWCGVSKITDINDDWTIVDTLVSSNPDVFYDSVRKKVILFSEEATYTADYIDEELGNFSKMVVNLVDGVDADNRDTDYVDGKIYICSSNNNSTIVEIFDIENKNLRGIVIDRFDDGGSLDNAIIVSDDGIALFCRYENNWSCKIIPLGKHLPYIPKNCGVKTYIKAKEQDGWRY